MTCNPHSRPQHKLPSAKYKNKKKRKTFQALKLDYFNDSSFFQHSQAISYKSEKFIFQLQKYSCDVHITEWNKGKKLRNFKIKFIIAFSHTSSIHLSSTFSCSSLFFVCFFVHLCAPPNFKQLRPRRMKKKKIFAIQEVGMNQSINWKGMESAWRAETIKCNFQYWTFNKRPYYYIVCVFMLLCCILAANTDNIVRF